MSEAKIKRTKRCDMLMVSPENLLKVADKSALQNLASFLGYGDTYIANTLTRGRISKDLLDKLCSFYGVDPSEVIVQEKPKQEAVPTQYMDSLFEELEKRITNIKDNFSGFIIQYMELTKRVSDVEDSAANLLSDCEKRFNEKIEMLTKKEDRDIAEIRKMITSLQTQIEQSNNRGTLDR